MMFFRKIVAVFICLNVLRSAAPGELNPIAIESIGHRSFRIISPTVLELGYVTSKPPDPAPVADWNFVGANFSPALPDSYAFRVEIDGRAIPIAAVGFKRRPLFAPLKTRDLRIANHLYLTLAEPIHEHCLVRVFNPAGDLWPPSVTNYAGIMDPWRYNPAIHVNQVGYAPEDPKRGMVGYYLGSSGELPVQPGSFSIVSTTTGQAVFTGQLRQRPDIGYNYQPKPYQNVCEADFSALTTPGEYRLSVAGLGVSFPFLIQPGVPAVFARTYALGLYHQRCGASNVLPHTRHEHGLCHSAPAAIPDLSFTTLNHQLATMSHDFADNPRHTAPQLKSSDASLYPFVNLGTVDVSGGHHDAGDYSKYTINSAGLIHHLVFAADALGAGDMDNLGLPESGDNLSDLLQEAKWEADFLAKMQDADGGFYFLVYPRNRAYEDDVLPDQGDPQSVFPKTTAATAAAVAALAEIASSPRFKQQFPADAARFLGKARLGWAFLMKAVQTHGKDGAYQKITHYGNEFMHDDELAWAAAAMFVATGEAEFHNKLLEFFPDPNDKKTRRWDWWRLFEGYGCAVRTYAFAARTGRLAPHQLNPDYLARCDAELIAGADDIARFAEQTAYGTSFPDPSKAYRTAGWYFSSERAFDLATGFQLAGSQRYLEAIATNLGYEAGCNPVNMTYITGLGFNRWREIVHQYALNDRRVLPPSGLPLGNIRGGVPYLDNYKRELGNLCFPPDGAAAAPFPFYDRFTDTFDTTTEFVVVDQARGLGLMSFLLARTGDNSSESQNILGNIIGLPEVVPAGTVVTATVGAAGVDWTGAVIVWEAKDQQPFIGETFAFAPKESGEQWVEVEAQLPDGRRVFGKGSFLASFSIAIPPNQFQSHPFPTNNDTAAVYRLDDDLADATGKQPVLSLTGNARLDSMNVGWMQSRSGAALRFYDLGDKATVTIPTARFYSMGITREITLETMIFVNAYKGWNRGQARILSLERGWNASLMLREELYDGPHIRGGTQFDFFGASLAVAMPVRQWHHLSISISDQGYSARVNGTLVASAASSQLAGWNGGYAFLELGNFDGWIDEVVLRSRGAELPAEPPRLVVASSSGKGVLLNWESPGQCTISVERSASVAGPFQLIESSLEGTEYLDSSVIHGQSYYYQLSAHYSTGQRASATAVQIKAITKPPAAPLRLIAQGTVQSIRITWAGMSTATQYSVYRATSPAGPYQRVWTGAGTEFEDSAAENSRSYFYFARASNSAGESANSVIIPGRVLSLPSAPSRVTATPTAGGVRITWVQGLNTDSFTLYRSTSKEGPFVAVSSKLYTTSFLDTAVQAGGTIHYSIGAVNVIGETRSATVSVTQSIGN